jgi:NADH-quinone oxidoreductase subunit N
MDCLLVRSFMAEGFLTFSIIMQLLVNAFIVKNLNYNFPTFNKELFQQTIFILVCLLFIVLNLNIETFIYNYLFINNSSIYFFKVIILIVSLLTTIVIYRSNIFQNINNLEFSSLLLIVLFSSFLLISAYDLLAVYLVLEMQSLCFYAFASFKRNSAASTEAGLKYFILGSLASCFFLLGLSIIYGCFGTLNLNDLLILSSFTFDNNFYALNTLLFFAFLTVICVFLFKLGVFPFHWWQPDVYEGAPLSSTIIFVLIPKLVFFCFLTKYIYIHINNFGIIRDFFLISGILTVSVGSVFAIQQKRLKRLYIFSSIAQVGFLVIILVTDFLEGYAFLYFFLFVYLNSSSLIWIFYSVLLDSMTKVKVFKSQGTEQILLSSLSNLFKKNKIWSFIFLVTFFSLAGIPPFAGFLAKFFVLFELLKNSYNFSTIFLTLISALSVYYYIRIVKILFFEPSKKVVNSLSLIFNGAIINLEYLIVSIGLIFLTALFINPKILMLIAQKLALGVL